MKDVHKNMGVGDHQFNVLSGLLVSTLNEAGVRKDIIDELKNQIEPLRRDIVTNTLYDKLGGYKSLKDVSSKFYDKVYVDNSANTFFKAFDKERQSVQMAKFLSQYCGGPKM
jgi:truncated hemoglobin YjbI